MTPQYGFPGYMLGCTGYMIGCTGCTLGCACYMLYAVECHQDMLTHRATHKEADLPCNKCDFKTKNVVELEEHIKTVHGVLVYRCNQCEFSCHAIEELWKHKMINHEAYEALSSDSTNSMLQMLLISMSGQIEYVVENMARLKIEATEGFKENRIQGDILEEKISKIEEKLEENRVALAKTFRFDAKIQNDSVAVYLGLLTNVKDWRIFCFQQVQRKIQ